MTCPHGHQWQPPADHDAHAADAPLLCPVCGTAVDPPAMELVASEAETLPPQPAANQEPASAAPTPLPSGAVAAAENRPSVPGYEILEELGRGGMGVVYKARHARLDRLVAIKILPAEVSGEPAFAERFTREARALARLNHPHIVAIYDFGQADEQSYFIMEYVEGSNLRQRLRAGRLQPHEAAGIAAWICDALQYAHEEGLVHRDIKPENILLENKGRVKIADFGIAKLLTRKTAEYTLTGPWQVVGTPHYMAPEQMDNAPILDHRADIYSLGVMLYEMLTGQLPLGRFLPPSQKGSVDHRFDEIVLRALEREPERRYQQVSEMKAALERLAKETRAEAEPGHIMKRSRPNSPGSPSDQDTAPYVEGGSVNLAVEASPGEKKKLGIGSMIGLACLLVAGLGLLLQTPYVGILLLLIFGLLGLGLAVRGVAVMRDLGRFLGAATGWAILFSLFGLIAILQPVFPWGVLDVVSYPLPGVTTRAAVEVYGYHSWFGIAAALVFLSLLLLLIVVGFIEPVSIWQPPTLMLAGIGVLLLMSFYVLRADPTQSAAPNFSGSVGGMAERVTFRPMPYVVAALGLGLLLLGAVQLRGVLLRRRKPAK
jgi:predicted Ser/Thr protein kinase